MKHLHHMEVRDQNGYPSLANVFAVNFLIYTHIAIHYSDSTSENYNRLGFNTAQHFEEAIQHAKEKLREKQTNNQLEEALKEMYKR